ncbi:udp-glucose 6-dehydrogenase [Xylariales sp. AK1849]|nr:udp-glucose 6-dehydrogenase [Xylariales sp. AK1849]
MDQVTVSIVDLEASAIPENTSSTAPTTPEDGLSFSPILRVTPSGSLDIVAASLASQALGNRSSTSALSNSGVRSVRNICCVGAGYVGGPTAAVIAYQNPHIRVTVVDRDEGRIRRWNSKHLPIHEPGLGDIIRIVRDGSRECSFIDDPSQLGMVDGSRLGGLTTIPARQPNLVFSTEIARCVGEADIVLIAVNTPTKSMGLGAGSATDMTAFEAVTSMVAQHARLGAIIVEKSTVPCGTNQLVQKTISIHRPGVHFDILSNPEFLAAGTATKDLMQPDRVLIGSTNTVSGRRAADALASVYAAWVPRSRIIITNAWSSELSKLVANAMLAQRISSMNSISAICEKTGAAVDEVAASIGFDPRIGDKFLKAGIGFGGSCFKKDILSLAYLAESLGLDEVGEYWRQVIEMNEYQRDRFSKRVVNCLNNTLVGKKITLLGYAFKANTSDTRGSPALEIIQTLLEEDPKEIAIYDPCCDQVAIRQEIKATLKGHVALKEDGGPTEVYSNAYEACAASNAILVTTECDEFRNRPLLNIKFVDPRSVEPLEPTNTEIMSLHKFLLRSQPASSPFEAESLPIYNDEPDCAEDCPDCGLANGCHSAVNNSDTCGPKEPLDWSEISYHLQKPKWVFDGKGIIDAAALEQLGVNVESVGRQGTI